MRMSARLFRHIDLFFIHHYKKLFFNHVNNVGSRNIYIRYHGVDGPAPAGKDCPRIAALPHCEENIAGAS